METGKFKCNKDKGLKVKGLMIKILPSFVFKLKNRINN